MPATRLSDRHRRSLRQLVLFGAIGGSGMLVNQAVTIITTKSLRGFCRIGYDDAMMNLLGSPFHVRWYHLISTLAFLVANLWNFQLNRTLNFRSGRHARWWGEFLPFLASGVFAYLLGLGVITALMNPDSPVALPRDLLDGTSGLRNPYFWANMISIAAVMPVNFLLAKLWAFKAMRSGCPVASAPAEELEPSREMG